MLRRLKFLVGARASAALDRAEDPGAALDYAYAKQMELLQSVRAGVADVATARTQLELQAQRLQHQLVQLEGQARQSLASGREDMARRALELKVSAQQQLRDLDPQLAALQQRQDQLTAQQQQLAEALARFRSEKEAQKARYAAAQTMVAIGEAAAGLSDDMAAAGLAVRRANEKTSHMEARAQALEELVSSGVLDNPAAGAKTQIERDLEDLTETQRVDHELEQLKAEALPPADDAP